MAHPDPRFALVDKGVHRVLLVAQGLSDLDHDVHHALEGGSEDLVVLGLTGLEPGLEALGFGPGETDYQLGGEAGGLLVLPAGDPDGAGLVGVVGQGGLVAGEVLEKPADIGAREPLVGDLAQDGELVSPGVGPARRQVGLLVPEKEAARLLEAGDLGQKLGQALVLLLGGFVPGHLIRPFLFRRPARTRSPFAGLGPPPVFAGRNRPAPGPAGPGGAGRARLR